MIDMNHKYQTRDGRAVRILCTDGPGDYYPVVGIIEGQKHTDSWTVNGIMSKCNAFPMDNLDLIPVPAKHEGWVVLLAGGDPRIDGMVKADKEEVEAFCERYPAYRAAHVTWED